MNDANYQKRLTIKGYDTVMKEREKKVGLLTFIVRYPRHMVRLRVENEGRILVCMATKSVERVHQLKGFINCQLWLALTFPGSFNSV